MNALSTLPQLPEAAQTPLGYEVYRGLISSQKSLSPWLFYDAEGSRLFEQITELPEYYPTRTERGILAERADEILDEASQGQRLRMIELGAGTATKTGLSARCGGATPGKCLLRADRCIRGRTG